jgi:hypothetical protein
MRRRWWWRAAAVAAFVGLLGGSAQAAITWLVATDQDCTGFGAATGLSTANIPCCRATAAGGGNVCGTRINAGANFIRAITFTVGASSAYTATGDALNAAAISRIGLTNIVYAICQGASTGQDVNFVQTAPTAGATWGAKLQLFQTGGGGTTPVTNGGEFVGSLANVSINCLLIGY